MKPLLIGECNPYGADPYYALVPYPDGCAGHRLCHLILGMTEDDYLERFERVNLCHGKWSMPAARARAREIWEQPGRFILLGAKVCAAWQTPFVPFEISDGGTALVLPHPSGLCRLWHQPGMFQKARTAVAAFALAPDTPTTAAATAVGQQQGAGGKGVEKP